MRSAFLILACLVSGFAAEGRYAVPFADVSWELPEAAKEADIDWSYRATAAHEPRIVLDNAASEAYLMPTASDQWSWNPWLTAADLRRDGFLVFSSGNDTCSGTLYIAGEYRRKMVKIPFRIAAGKAKVDAEHFVQAKAAHYRKLSDSGAPGTAWFRHQAKSNAVTAPNQPWQNRSDFDDTFDLFSGGRALSENLQLDRDLQLPNDLGPDSVDLSTLTGITIAEMDWKKALAGKQPELDALAAAVPFDQHALFFPTFQALLDFFDDADAHGTPIVQALEPRAEDAKTKERYQRQLCLEVSELARKFGAQVVDSVAMTGSDPFVRDGTDVAVIFAAKQPEALVAFLAAKQTASGAAAKSGKLGEVAYSSVVDANRSVCSYLATIGGKVVVTNSLAQLERLSKVASKTEKSLAELDEYRFFRDRYQRGQDGESAFLMLPDAAIRRWCSPRWRIAASRRMRAAAALSEMHARHFENFAKQTVPTALDNTGLAAEGLGSVTFADGVIRSSVYNTLEFLTPIAELPIDRASKAEADAYTRFRDSYQQRWRRYFDPLAVQFSRADKDLGLDLSIMPLIADSDYRDFIATIGKSAIAADAGDRHAGTLLHWVMAIDRSSEPMQQSGNMFGSMIPGLRGDPFAWLGKSIALYADEDPFWDEVSKSDNSDAFFEKNLHRLPLALRVEVSDPLKLTLFLTALHGFMDTSAPGMTIWKTLDVDGKPYVRISPAESAKGQLGEELKDLAIYYAATPDSLVVTLNEGLLKRALERQGKTAESADVSPWLGESMAFQAKGGALGLLAALSGNSSNNSLRDRAWANLPILNEWKRLFPDLDPVQVHERIFGIRLLCPAGGDYVYDEEWQTMSSTLYGHPGAPKEGPKVPATLQKISLANAGITFEHDGLRAKLVLSQQ